MTSNFTRVEAPEPQQEASDSSHDLISLLVSRNVKYHALEFFRMHQVTTEEFLEMIPEELFRDVKDIPTVVVRRIMRLQEDIRNGLVSKCDDSASKETSQSERPTQKEATFHGTRLNKTELAGVSESRSPLCKPSSLNTIGTDSTEHTDKNIFVKDESYFASPSTPSKSKKSLNPRSNVIAEIDLKEDGDNSYLYESKSIKTEYREVEETRPKTSKGMASPKVSKRQKVSLSQDAHQTDMNQVYFDLTSADPMDTHVVEPMGNWGKPFGSSIQVDNYSFDTPSTGRTVKSEANARLKMSSFEKCWDSLHEDSKYDVWKLLGQLHQAHSKSVLVSAFGLMMFLEDRSIALEKRVALPASIRSILRVCNPLENVCLTDLSQFRQSWADADFPRTHEEISLLRSWAETQSKDPSKVMNYFQMQLLLCFCLSFVYIDYAQAQANLLELEARLDSINKPPQVQYSSSDFLSSSQPTPQSYRARFVEGQTKFLLGLLTSSAQTKSSSASTKSAEEYFRQATKATGHAEAQYQMSEIMRKRGVNPQIVSGVTNALTAAADRGLILAEWKLAKFLFVRQKPRDWYTRFCELLRRPILAGHIKSTLFVAEVHCQTYRGPAESVSGRVPTSLISAMAHAATNILTPDPDMMQGDKPVDDFSDGAADMDGIEIGDRLYHVVNSVATLGRSVPSAIALGRMLHNRGPVRLRAEAKAEQYLENVIDRIESLPKEVNNKRLSGALKSLKDLQITAMAHLGRLLTASRVPGSAETPRTEKGVHLLRAAAELGNADACYNLGTYLSKPTKMFGAVAKGDTYEGLRWLQKACELKSPQALFELGEKLWSPSSSQANNWSALRMLSEAAARHHHEARIYCVSILTSFSDIPSDICMEMEPWLRAFADQDNSDALYILAKLGEANKLGSKSTRKYHSFYQRAARMGHPSAMEKVGGSNSSNLENGDTDGANDADLLA